MLRRSKWLNNCQNLMADVVFQSFWRFVGQWKKLSWTNKIILIVGPIDRLTYARKYFIFGKFSNNCQIKIFDHCSHRKFSLSSRKIPFIFLKYWYGDFSNCRKGILLLLLFPFSLQNRSILNHYLYYALNNESCMSKFQAIICHRSFVEIKMLGFRYVAGGYSWKESEKENHRKWWQAGENEEVWGK